MESRPEDRQEGPAINTVLWPCPGPAALDAARRAFAWTRRAGKAPTVGELWSERGARPDVLGELVNEGLVIVVPPPSPHDAPDRAVVVVTRNVPRLANREEAVWWLALVIGVREAIAARLRSHGPGWWSLSELAQVVGEPIGSVALALCLLLADETSPNARQLSPFGGAPGEFWVDLALATADVDSDPESVEILTGAQYRIGFNRLLKTGAEPSAEADDDRPPPVKQQVWARLDDWNGSGHLASFENRQKLVEALCAAIRSRAGSPRAPSVDARAREWADARGVSLPAPRARTRG